MKLYEEQEALQADCRDFVRAEIAPHADDWDRDGRVPEWVIAALAAREYLGALIPKAYGGAELGAVSFGILNEVLGSGCSSVRSLLTVHSMVAFAVQRWGTERQREFWLPRMARGDCVAAFALTEPAAGSDAAEIATVARANGAKFYLTGSKKWITFGQRADLFLCFARAPEGITAYLVPRQSPGLTVTPVSGMLGTRASLLAELSLEDCEVSTESLLGKRGLGLSLVAASALEIGRYSVACGCVGLAQACLDLSIEHSSTREQFGQPLRKHQLVQRMLADMATNLSLARLACRWAGHLREIDDPQVIQATWMAKYFASTTAFAAASDTVQLHGARGCAPGAVQRLLRDAKIMEIIEGNTQLQQVMIAETACQDFARRVSADHSRRREA
jgi:hypothetical protein